MLYRLPVALSALLSLAAVVVATPASLERLYGLERRSTGRSCGNHPTPEVVSQKEKDYMSRIEGQSPIDNGHGEWKVPVYFNVISFDGEGDIP